MKRFVFGAFQVTSQNKDAFEVCSEVANLHAVAPQPVVLVGPRGSGKTHLLYSIVNRVRGSSRLGGSQAKAAVAYVTPRDFPEEVAALAADPMPLGRVNAAVLLVDDVDRFDENAESLGLVIRQFLESGHSVVVACEQRPELFAKVADDLGNLLSGGLVVELAPRESAAHVHDEGRVRADAQQVLREAQSLLAAMRQSTMREEDELPEHAFAKSTVDAGLRADVAAVRRGLEAQVVTLEAELAEIRRQHEEEFFQYRHFDEERAALGAEIEALRCECAQLKKVLVEARSERETARERLKRATEQLEKQAEELRYYKEAAAAHVAGTDAEMAVKSLHEELSRQRDAERVMSEEMGLVRRRLMEALDLLDAMAASQTRTGEERDRDADTGTVGPAEWPNGHGTELDRANTVAFPAGPGGARDARRAAAPLRVLRGDAEGGAGATGREGSLHHVEQLNDSLDILGPLENRPTPGFYRRERPDDAASI